MEQSDLGPHCWQYRQPKYISRCESRQQLVIMADEELNEKESSAHFTVNSEIFPETSHICEVSRK